MLRTTFTALCIVKFLGSCNEPVEKKAEPAPPDFSLTKHAVIDRSNPYYKVIYIYDQAVHMHVTAKADSMEYFDFNIIDKDSYQNYAPGKELKYLNKIPDRKSIDTIITLDKGSYLFSFENVKNTNPIRLNIKLKTVE